MRTERWAGLVDAMARDMKIPREQADKLAPASIPMGRIAEVEEVAEPRRHAGVAADGDGQRHHDRDRRRPGQGADGPIPRPSGGIIGRPRLETVKLGRIVGQRFAPRRLVGNPVEQHVEQHRVVRHGDARCRMRPVARP